MFRSCDSSGRMPLYIRILDQQNSVTRPITVADEYTVLRPHHAALDGIEWFYSFSFCMSLLDYNRICSHRMSHMGKQINIKLVSVDCSRNAMWKFNV